MKYLRRLIPFKGTWFYEMQVGPWVIQLRHTDLGDFKRLLIWHDSCWRL